jgi:hypothetical protein
VKRAAFTSYLRAKYAAINQLPDPQEQRVNEEPSTSEQGEWKSPYLDVKGPADTSLGVPIDASRAQRWKDRMILAYDRIKKELTDMPFFKEIYEEMGPRAGGTGGGSTPMEPILRVFNDLINSYVVNVANSNLKDAFLFGVKYVAAFNDLRDMLPRMVKDRQHMFALDAAIWSTQKFIWKRVKDLLNIHDIGSADISLPPEEAAEMKKILGKLPRGTWTYGPMKDPTKPPFQRPENPMMAERRRLRKG